MAWHWSFHPLYTPFAFSDIYGMNLVHGLNSHASCYLPVFGFRYTLFMHVAVVIETGTYFG